MNQRLPTRLIEKVWGRDELPAPFEASSGERIGEIWFEPPDELPGLLAKYIFTSQKLSIQTHPSDEQTETKGVGRQGKEECWLILDAEPDAKIAVGFKTAVSVAEMRAAALDGSIEEMLVWHPVSRGDFYYIPANTVHAIGGGVSLLEVQQNSDITYRLYDYGRPRELHLDEGMAVAKGEPYPDKYRGHVGELESVRLVDGPYFLLDKVAGLPGAGSLRAYGNEALLVLPLEGHAIVGNTRVDAGCCALADSLAEIEFSPSSNVILAQPVRT